MNLEEAIQTLAQECAELLDAMENALLRLEHVPTDPDLINEVFRAAHTIKGSAGLFGLPLIVTFTHRVESVLDRVRDKSRAMDANLVTLLLRFQSPAFAAKAPSSPAAGVSALPHGVDCPLHAKLRVSHSEAQ